MFLILLMVLIENSCFKLDHYEEEINNQIFLIDALHLKKSRDIHSKYHHECIQMPFQYKNFQYNACLILSSEPSSELIEKNSFIFSHRNLTNLSQLDINFVEGYINGYENASFIDGYIDEDSFYGRIVVANNLFYVEKASKFPLLKSNRSTAVSRHTADINVSYFRENLPRRRRNAMEGNICTLIALIDYSFYYYIAGSNRETTIAIVLNSLSRVNSIFRSSDFNDDGVPDNIGFRVLYSILIDTEEELNPFIIPYRKRPINGRSYLARITYFPRFQEACLGIVFTAQAFAKNIIGLSYTATDYVRRNGLVSWSGGICDTGSIRNFNIAIVTYRHTKGHLLPQLLCDLSLAHELGHSFGATHDKGKKCYGYLMSSQATRQILPSTFLFSPCSNLQINHRLISRRKMCLESNKEKFCGNGIKESDEECDCGSFYRCLHFDRCCLPYDHPHPCTVNRYEGYQCHPSQGLCCTDECIYRDISYLGLSCANFAQSCNNSTKNLSQPCGISGTCENNVCHSNECMRIGLLECPCGPEIMENRCQICCLYNGHCFPAHKITKILVEQDLDLLEVFKRDKVILTNADKMYKICKDERCYQLTFKQFQSGDFCVIYGKLGICSSEYTCYESIVQYESLPSGFIVNFNSKLINIYLFVVNLILLINIFI